MLLARADTEFWAALGGFVDKFSAAQRALISERKDREEREARRKWVQGGREGGVQGHLHTSQPLFPCSGPFLSTFPA